MAGCFYFCKKGTNKPFEYFLITMLEYFSILIIKNT